MTKRNAMAEADDILVFAHIGDLHITEPGLENHRDFRAIVSEINDELADGIDFVYVPGDNADNGLPSQYALVREELARLNVPVHIVTGDHDMEPGSLDNFYRGLEAAPLPKAVDAGGIRCLFLDICGPGSGGPDFRLGGDQRRWLTNQLKDAAACKRRCAIFMHSYPADLKGDRETDVINQAFAAEEVLLVDVGHTHYNEVANDGRTIFTATRSTGQIEEGPVGYSIATIDRRVVSWRFRELAGSLPIVLITAPADRRLVTDENDRDQQPDGTCDLRVSVLGKRDIVSCRCSLDGGAPLEMKCLARGRYGLALSLPPGARKISVEALNETGDVGRESIELQHPGDPLVERHADGSDADSVGAWEERALLGTQLGPNRNGHQW